MKKIILTLLIFSFAIAVALVLSWPAFGRFRELTASIEQKQQDLKDFENYIAHLQNISKQIQDNSAGLTKVEAALTGEDYIPNLFDFIQKSASGAGTRIDEIKLGNVAVTKESKNIIQREASLSMRGTYTSLRNFLTTLEKSARIIEFTKISLSTVSATTMGQVQGSSKETLPSLSFDMKVYSYQP